MEAGAVPAHARARTIAVARPRLIPDASIPAPADAVRPADSGGEFATYGVREAADVHAWADLLLARPGVERLYGLGQSMGAAILIESLAKESRFCALAGAGHVAGFSRDPDQYARCVLAYFAAHRELVPRN